MTLTDCLTNYIGLDAKCTPDTPISGIYVNSLPGISIQMIAKLSDIDTEDFQGVFDEIYTRSLIQLESDALAQMQKSYKTRILLDNAQAGFYNTPYETVSSANNYNGWQIRTLTGKNTTQFINSVTIFLETVVGLGSIKIFDLNSGLTIDTITFDPVIGENLIQINKRYSIAGQEKRIFIGYNGNVGDTITTQLGGVDDYSRYAILTPGQIPIGSTPIDSNMNKSGDSRGLVVNFNTECSLSNFLCQNRDYLKTPLWYLLGANLMEERMISSRMSKYTLNNKEEAKKLMKVLKDRYERDLEINLKNLTPGSDEFCFPCEKARTIKYNLP